MEYCRAFLADLHSRLSNRIQITTDGLHQYARGIMDGFRMDDVDYAILEKVYRVGVNSTPDCRYSPSDLLRVKAEPLFGHPKREHISTSYVERQNLTMRMGMRRFTRLTNGFSKKVGNHQAAVALHFTHYTFCRVHQTLRVTPAMAAGLTDQVWSLSELIGLLEK